MTAVAVTTSPRTTTVRAPRVSTFSSLRTRNFRLFAIGQVVSNTGSWVQRIAQDWLVLTLTGSATAVGITTALQFVPMLLLGLVGGLLADRYSKRAILMGTQVGMAVLAGTLAYLALSDRVAVWHVYLIAFVLGIVTAADNPARQAFVNEMVGPEQLRNAACKDECHRADGGDHDDDADERQQRGRVLFGLSGQQQRGGDRTGACDQRNGQRKRGDVACMLLDGPFGLPRLAGGANAEHHFTGDDKQEDTAGYPESRQTDTEPRQEPVSDQRGTDQDRCSDYRRAIADASADGGGQSMRDRQECRRDPDRIDHDEQRHKRIERVFGKHEHSAGRQRCHRFTSLA